MTARDRLLKAFSFETVRPTPYTIWYDHEIRERLNACFGGDAWRQGIDDAILRLIIDWEPKTPIGAGRYRDLHGSIWQTGAIPHIVEPVLKEPSLKGVAIPDYVPYLRRSETPATDRHQALPRLGFEAARRRIQDEKQRKLVVVQICHGLFECSWMMRGFENLFVDMIENPAFCHQLYDALLERHLQLVDAMLELDSDGIIFVDDYGDQRGIIMGPDLWRTFIQPRLRQLYQRVHQAGKWTFQHSCGNVSDIIPDLIESGLDVLQSLQPEAMCPDTTKQRYGRDLRFWGGLGTQQLLPKGTPAEIRTEVRRLRARMGEGGGYCFSTSKPIMPDVPLENAVALIEATLGDAG